LVLFSIFIPLSLPKRYTVNYFVIK
jgi:hypothetical protein